MNAVFYIAAAVATVSTAMVICMKDAVHALLYLVVSLLSVALVFFALGAPFIAALEVIVYAGAIVVLFVFVVTMLNLGPAARQQESLWLRPGTWMGPSFLAFILLAELVYVFAGGYGRRSGGVTITPQETGFALFGPYIVGVELASLLLLAGLVGAFHIGRRTKP
jgi:NADH-quinone oxidoreductase subunit J